MVGVDTSPCAEAALRWALAEADHTGRPVHAVLCHHRGGDHRHPVTQALMVRQDADAVEALAGCVHDVLCQVGIRRDVQWVTQEVVAVGPGGVEEVLLARAWSAAMLVVGRRGIHGPGRRMLGSVSSRLAGCSPCPVVVVPGWRP